MKKLFFLFLFTSLFNDCYSQLSIQESYSVSWDNVLASKEKTNSSKFLTHDNQLKLYLRIPFSKDLSLSGFEFTANKYSLISNDSLSSYNIKPSDSINVSYNVSSSIDSNYLNVIVNLILNNGNNSHQALASFNLNYDFSAVTIASSSNFMFNNRSVSSSVLSFGDWVKIDVSNSGIYKLNYADINSFFSSDILINQLHVFGNPSGTMSEDNSLFFYDDLTQNSIQVFDLDNNGYFSSNDYILFYAQGPDKWTYSGVNPKYTKNYQSLTSSYYFTVSSSYTSKFIPNQNNELLTPSTSIGTVTRFKHHELDEYNLVKSGREWFGDKFDNSTSKQFQFVFPSIDISEPIELEIKFASSSVGGQSGFDVYLNNSFQYKLNLNAISGSYTAPVATVRSRTTNAYVSSSNINLDIDYNKYSASSIGYIDYINLVVKSKLDFNGTQFDFRDLDNVGSGNIVNFQLENYNSSYKIWDVTDITNVENVVVNNGSFNVENDSIKEFIAFNSAYNISSISKIANQNLHSYADIDYVIVSHTSFLSSANRLASFHNNRGLSTIVVTPEQIYNEYSSGTKDITAIKKFMKMLYDKASGDVSKMPKYLLLFGDASYDFKNILGYGNNFVPTFQSQNSISPVGSYCTDDYFGFLGDNESASLSDIVDLGIGRFPVQNISEANVLVDKVISYATQSKSFGNWRNVLTFVADDEDNNLHVIDTDFLVNDIYSKNKQFNYNKIYVDAYEQVSTSGGTRYPGAKEDIRLSVEKGTLLLNYVGHGGETGLGHEKFVDVPLINSWTNKDRLSVFMTATCEFSRFDDPARTSAGEYCVLNPNGGVVSLFTTTRLVFSNANSEINSNFYDYCFIVENDKPLGFGEILKRTKNVTSPTINKRNFTLLGDPSLEMGFATNQVVTNKINFQDVTTSDTISALMKVHVEGEVLDLNDNLLTDFNGLVLPTIYDKFSIEETLGNDPASSEFDYLVQNNKLFSGKSNTTNGKFSFEFIVPKDINYEFGNGKISYYALDETIQASGFNTDIIVGGEAENPVIDNEGPEIEIYLNDENFISGAIVNSNPLLIVKLNDENGINTSGTTVGHDIVLRFNDSQDEIVLNEFYEADSNTYKSGSINYPFSQLEEGKYTLLIKAWDVNNNSNESSVVFEVKNQEELAIENVLNFPNPFTTSTEFYFNHNQPGANLQVNLTIFTISGKVVKSFQVSMLTSGYISDPIYWNGTDEFGDLLANGVYIYKLEVKTPDGKSVEKIEKVVLL